jgi:hypothetical protein
MAKKPTTKNSKIIFCEGPDFYKSVNQLEYSCTSHFGEVVSRAHATAVVFFFITALFFILQTFIFLTWV